MRKLWVLALVIALSISPAYAACPEGSWGKYIGWEQRFLGDLSLGSTTSWGDFDVKLERILASDAVRVEVLKDGSPYVTSSIAAGDDNILKKSDILIELYNAIMSTSAYIGVYTPEGANITANVTNIELLATEGTRTNLLPREEFRLYISINNTGELEAKDIHVTPQLGDFEILDTNVKDRRSLCQGSTYDFKYTLKTPDFRKTFNYTLYFKLDYSDENIQTGTTGHHTTYYPFDMEITPAQLELSRITGNWTLRNPGRGVSVKLMMNNTGSEKAKNVEWAADLPPYIEVQKGTASFSGYVLDGTTKTLSYTMISDDPVKCRAVSRVTFEDRAKNNYTSFSNNETFRFSPFITIKKEVGGLLWHVDPLKNVMLDTTTYSIDEADWWERGTTEVNVDAPAKVALNKTRDIEVTVKFKNTGNAVARDITVNETLGDMESTGTTSWAGELGPDEEASYSYKVNVLKHGNLSFATNAAYLDVDPASFKPTLDGIEGKPSTRYCTVTLRKVSFGTKDEFYGMFHNVTINQTGGLNVLAGSEFDFNITLLNAGSDSVHDLLTRINTSNLRKNLEYGGEILKGQSVYYLDELRAKYFPTGTSRSWSQTNASYGLILRAPGVEENEIFEITTTVEFIDSNGTSYTNNITTNVNVFKEVPAYAVVTLVGKDLSVTPGAPEDMEIGGYGDAYLKVRNTGYTDLKNVTVKITVPAGFEIYSNDTAWRGIFEAQLRRFNETLYGYTGEMVRNDSLNSSKQITFPLLIRGKKAGTYDVNYRIDFDGGSLTGSFPVKVKGAILKIEKSLDKTRAGVNQAADVTVTVSNIGEATAEYIFITDLVPSNFEVTGRTDTNITELKPGSEATLNYQIRVPAEGTYTLGGAEVTWVDSLGNEYQKRSSGLTFEVLKEVKEEEEKADDGVEGAGKLSPTQAIIAALISFVFIGIIFKLLLLSKPVSEE